MEFAEVSGPDMCQHSYELIVQKMVLFQQFIIKCYFYEAKNASIRELWKSLFILYFSVAGFQVVIPRLFLLQLLIG